MASGTQNSPIYNIYRTSRLEFKIILYIKYNRIKSLNSIIVLWIVVRSKRLTGLNVLGLEQF